MIRHDSIRDFALVKSRLPALNRVSADLDAEKLQSMRTIAMIKILLAIALVAACSTTALAAQGKSQALTGGPYVYGTEDEKLIGSGAFVPHSKRLKDALGGFNRGDPNDPYWDPCISYQRNWGVGACGGN